MRVLVASLLLLAWAVPARAGVLAPEQRLHELLDRARLGVGLRPVDVAPDLVALAREHARRMADERRLYHDPSVAQRAGGRWSGDLIGHGTDDADAVHAAFMASSTHRSVRMAARSYEVGIGVVERDGELWVSEVHRQPDGTEAAAFDGQPATTLRVDRSDPVAAAVSASRQRFTSDQAGSATLARSDVFADALAGAPLTVDGPLLLTGRDRLPAATRDELRRVLSSGATVRLLGGEAAIGPAVAEDLRAAGYQVRRLAGATRIGTALAVADEVRQRTGSTVVALARAFGTRADASAGWADSVTGGAWASAFGVPIVITHSDRLDPDVDAWLDRVGPSRTVLLGGTVALSEAVEASVPSPHRVAGAARDGTAARIATELWASHAGVARFTVVDGYGSAGWAFGLPSSGLAADRGAPLLVVTPDGVPAETRDAVSRCGTELVVVGSATVVSEGARGALDAAERC